MAKIYKNDKNFLIIQMNGEEASNLGFGIEITGCLNSIVCGSCNSSIEDKDIYYIAGINEVMCKACAYDYIKNMSHYIDYDTIQSVNLLWKKIQKNGYFSQFHLIYRNLPFFFFFTSSIEISYFLLFITSYCMRITTLCFIY